MREKVAVVICVVAVAGPAAGAATTPVNSLALASRLAGLTVRGRVLVKMVRGEAFSARAREMLDRDYPPADQRFDEALYRLLGLLTPTQSLRPSLLAHARASDALYDPTSRTVFVRSRSGTASLEGLIVALEHQTFQLRGLTTQRSSDRDAALAGSAAVAGEAAFSAEVLGHLRPPRPSTSGPLPIARFLTLEDGFASGLGRAFAATLWNLGGRSAVFTALRRLPTTTRQILHIDAFLARELPASVVLPRAGGSFVLAASNTWGELDLRALLAVFGVPGPVPAWTGGRAGLYADGPEGQAAMLELAFETPADSLMWRLAARAYVVSAFSGSRSTPCPAEECWTTSVGGIAFARSGTLTRLAFAPSPADASRLALADGFSTSS